jgi:hypothetical protein
VLVPIWSTKTSPVGHQAFLCNHRPPSRPQPLVSFQRPHDAPFFRLKPRLQEPPDGGVTERLAHKTFEQAAPIGDGGRSGRSFTSSSRSLWAVSSISLGACRLPCLV